MFNCNYKLYIPLFVKSQFSYRITSVYILSANVEFVYISVLQLIFT